MALAVRRFQEFNTLCNKAITRYLLPTIKGLQGVRHDHLLPYLSCHHQSSALFIVMPLCVQDLGQYICHLQTTLFENPNCSDNLRPYLKVMVNQVIAFFHEYFVTVFNIEVILCNMIVGLSSGRNT